MNQLEVAAVSTRFAIRRRLAAIPWLVKAKRRVERLVDGGLHPIAGETIEQLPLYAPNSWGASDARARLTVQAANQIFPFMARFIETAGHKPLLRALRSEQFCAAPASREAADLLKQAFDRHGSDKATLHGYHHIYGTILEDGAAVDAVLEVGLGTNNTGVVSNMGRAGRPGASLRAFRDYLPNAKIYGADLDRGILFQEERISTFFVDQTDPASFDALARNVPGELDLIIDDGLHSPNANVAVMTFALPRLKAGGWLVIEDIVASALPVWQVMAALVPPGFESHLFSDRGALVFAVRKTPRLRPAETGGVR